jgi:hypothetical protein
MQLTEVPAKTGYVWFRQGIALFFKNPLAFLAAFFTYLIAMTLVSLLPLIGKVLPLLLIPGIAAGFMAACRDTLAGKPVFPTILADGFRAYGRPAAQQLLMLGCAYVVAIALISGATALIDGGMLFQMMMGGVKIDQKMLANSAAPLAMLAALALYVPVSMLFWFAPVLCAWHDVPSMKAMFFSIVSCWRNRGAFTVYAVLWCAFAMTVSFGLSLLMLALGQAAYALNVLIIVSVILSAMFYCSFYPTYCSCFGIKMSEKDKKDIRGRPST